jgi:chromosome segregation ATPase
MTSVFGGTMVAPDIGTAKRVAYARDVQAKCVTYDGDSADPRGKKTYCFLVFLIRTKVRQRSC